MNISNNTVQMKKQQQSINFEQNIQEQVFNFV